MDITRAIARGPQDYDGTASYFSAAYMLGFGSNHAGVINFLVGDGSVHGISTTANHENLLRLSMANDGASASLP
jgi:hypothetical protein